MERNLTREDCLELLKSKAKEIGRMPQRGDFDEFCVVKIKGFFGPWPHALEAAGLKSAKNEVRIKKNREKRRKAKSKLNMKRKEQKSTDIKQTEITQNKV